MSQFCKNCGTPLAADATFCQKCGTKVDAAGQADENTAAPAQPQPAYAPAQPKKKNLGLIFGIIGGVVAVGAIVLVLFLTGILGGEVDISDIEGKWYSRDIMIDFDEDGSLRIETEEDTIRGTFEYDPDNKEGVISSDERDYDDEVFELDRDELILNDVVYIRDKDESGYGMPKIADQIAGLWHAVEATYAGQTGDVAAMGMAFEFDADGNVAEYEGYQQTETGTWQVLEDGALKLTASDGDVLTFENIEVDEDGEGFTADVTTDDGTGSMRFVKTDAETFAAAMDDLSDQLQGFWWVVGSNQYPPVSDDVIGEGLAIAFDGMTMDFYAYFEVDTLGIDYEFVDTDTIAYFEDGQDYTVDISFEVMNGQQFLVFGNEIETLYLLPSSYDEYMATADTLATQTPAVPTENTSYTSDADINALIVREWNEYVYLYADGTEDTDIEQDNMIFYDDGTFAEVLEGESMSGYWSVAGGVLTMSYSDDEAYSWPVFIEFRADMQAYLLYFEMYDDYGQGSGEYYVYTDYQP